MSILDNLNSQPEFKTPIWDYMASLVDDTRVSEGQAQMARYQPVLQQISAQYGVDPAVVVAVWGVESNYGQNFGKRPLIQSLGTLSCYGRRQSYFKGEFFSALRILQSGDIAESDLNGSWAGAFGHTQFMPSTFERLAVDFDGDGRRDLVGNAEDALASTANYLKRSGWVSGQPWGFEVRLPAGFNASQAGRTKRQNLQYWANKGVTTVDGQPLSSQVAGNPRAAILLPAGASGPAFVVFKNFDAIYSYNAAESYALAIAHLSDRLKGKGSFATPWPTDDPGLSRAEQIELQNLLIRHGHSELTADGIIGGQTREAIKAEEQKLGMAPSGRAGQKILRALRSGGAF